MLIATQSRGPWLGAILAAVISGASLQKKQGWQLVFRLCVLVMAGLGGKALLNWYTSQESGDNEMKETVRYRMELQARTQKFINGKPIFGWGVRNWPISRNTVQASIDNAYLYYAIKRGIPGVALFTLLMLWQAILAFRRSWKRPAKSGGKKVVSLEVTIFGIQLLTLLPLGTVWVDLHLLQVFLVLSGMSANVLARRRPFTLTSSVDEYPQPKLVTAGGIS